MKFHRIVFVAAAVSSFVCVDAIAKLPIGRFVDDRALPPLTVPGVSEHPDSSPSISSDGLELFADPGRGPTSLIYRATRTGLEEEFSDASAITEIGMDASASSISSDGLTLYFDSTRSGGHGDSDIYQATRPSIGSPFGNVMNLGTGVNGSTTDRSPSISSDGLTLYFHRDGELFQATRMSAEDSFGAAVSLGQKIKGDGGDFNPSISKDGLTLVFHSSRAGIKNQFRDLLVATRDSIDEPFGHAVNLDDFSLASNINSGDKLAVTSADLSVDWPAPGSKLYYSIAGSTGDLREATWVPERLPRVPISTGITYVQNFDGALSADGETGPLPSGWTAIANGASVKTSTTQSFPPGPRVLKQAVFNVGEPEQTDRALAIGVPSGGRSGQAPAPWNQLLSEVSDGDARGLQLQFDLETWDAAGRSAKPGVAAFHVSLDIDTGDGFQELHDFGDIRIAELIAPDGDFLNGNLEENRAAFDGVLDADLPQGSTLRIRWEVPDLEVSQGWVFGIDNVQLNLFNSLIDAFDCNGDGILDVLDANCAPALSLDNTLSAANHLSTRCIEERSRSERGGATSCNFELAMTNRKIDKTADRNDKESWRSNGPFGDATTLRSSKPTRRNRAECCANVTTGCSNCSTSS